MAAYDQYGLPITEPTEPVQKTASTDNSIGFDLALSKLDVPKLQVFPLALTSTVSTSSADIDATFVKFSIFETTVGRAIQSVVGKKISDPNAPNINIVKNKVDDPSTTLSPNDRIETDGRGRENYKKTAFIERLDRHIFLPMPQALSYTDGLSWQDSNTTFIDDVADYVINSKDGSNNGLISAVLGKYAAALQKSEKYGFAANSALRNARIAVNEKKEFMFQGVDKRSFTFSYEFAPKSKQEAEALINIIKTFRYHSYPELITQSSQAGFYIYPANFQIDFYKGSSVNTAINKISICIVEKIETDMTPSGTWVNLPNGYPPVIRFAIVFQELEALDKRRIVAGF